MLPLVYTVTPELKELLPTIDALRQTLLSIPISPAREQGLRWEAKLTRLQATFSLAGVALTPAHIADILTLPARQTHASTITGYAHVFDRIADTYTASSKPVSFAFIEEAASLIYRGQYAGFIRDIRKNQSAIRELLMYLSPQTEHPVISAGIAHGMLASSILPQSAPGLMPRILYWLLLAKYGYDCRGLIMPEVLWAAEPISYRDAIADARARGNLSQWLFYVADSYQRHLESRIPLIREQSVTQNLLPYWRLNDRQRAIMHSMENPSISITNKIIQKRFKVSQITASRDLAKLTFLHLLAAHGKGRSVSYTRL